MEKKIIFEIDRLKSLMNIISENTITSFMNDIDEIVKILKSLRNETGAVKGATRKEAEIFNKLYKEIEYAESVNKSLNEITRLSDDELRFLNSQQGKNEWNSLMQKLKSTGVDNDTIGLLQRQHSDLLNKQSTIHSAPGNAAPVVDAQLQSTVDNILNTEPIFDEQKNIFDKFLSDKKIKFSNRLTKEDFLEEMSKKLNMYNQNISEFYTKFNQLTPTQKLKLCQKVESDLQQALGPTEWSKITKKFGNLIDKSNPNKTFSRLIKIYKWGILTSFAYNIATFNPSAPIDSILNVVSSLIWPKQIIAKLASYFSGLPQSTSTDDTKPMPAYNPRKQQ